MCTVRCSSGVYVADGLILELLQLLLQGFVSVSADYIFPAQCDACTRSFEHIPSFTTVPLHVPEGCPPARHSANGTHVVGGVVLKVNLVTSVVGYVKIELQDASGDALDGFSLETSDQLKGNCVFTGHRQA